MDPTARGGRAFETDFEAFRPEVVGGRGWAEDEELGNDAAPKNSARMSSVISSEFSLDMTGARGGVKVSVDVLDRARGFLLLGLRDRGVRSGVEDAEAGGEVTVEGRVRVDLTEE